MYDAAGHLSFLPSSWLGGGHTNRHQQMLHRILQTVVNETTNVAPTDNETVIDADEAEDVGDWTCRIVGEASDSLFCFSHTIPAYGMGPLAPVTARPIFQCDTDDWLWTNTTTTTTTTTGVPRRPTCTDLCLIQDTVSNQFCSACKLLANGQVAYDCTNVYNDDNSNTTAQETSLCTSRNEFGQCANKDNNVDVYKGYWCSDEPFAGGGGYQCGPIGSTPDLFNGALNMSLLLYCTDIVEGGLTLDLCGVTKCNLINSQRETCDACVITPDSKFAYDCTNLFPDTYCARTDVNGTCQPALPREPPLPPVPDRVREAARNAQCETKSEAAAAAHDDDGWVLERMDVNVFNFISDLVAFVTRVLFGLALAVMYTGLMSWHMTAGHGIPVTALAWIPGDVVAATQWARTLQFTIPALLIAVLLLVADLSHSMADLGLTAVTITEPGSLQPVLSLRTADRNPQRPLQTAGDPLTPRTDIYVDYGGSDFGLDTKTDVLSETMLAAGAQLARGSSPFLNGVGRDYLFYPISTLGGVTVQTIVGICEDDAVVEIAIDIPLECASPNMSTIHQINVGQIVDKTIRNTALVPNCTYFRERASGVYQDASMPRRAAGWPQILETAGMAGIAPVGIYNTSARLLVGNDDDNNNETALVVELSPAEKKFARDRVDWTQGRTVSNVVKGIQIGNETIRFASAVLATGPETGVFPTSAGNNGVALYQRRSDYHIFGEVEGPCPTRPSGRSTEGLACIASAVVKCDTFEEDYQFSGNDLFFPTSSSSCELSRVNVVWGANFVADDELVAVLAGLYGNVKPEFRDFGERRFMLHGILGALFVMGTLVERPSVEIKVRPKLSGVYVCFMLLPGAVAVLGFLVAWLLRDQNLPVPSLSWDLLVLGKELASDDKIPTRRNKLDKFGPADPQLVLRLRRKQAPQQNSRNGTTGGTAELDLVREPKRSSSRHSGLKAAQRDNAVLETPVAPSEKLEDPQLADAPATGISKTSDIETPSSDSKDRLPSSLMDPVDETSLGLFST